MFRVMNEDHLFAVAMLNGFDSFDISRENDVGQFFDDGSILNNEEDRETRRDI